MSKYKMLKWAKDLFPIHRSITGEGTRKTLSYFEKINPEFKRLKYKTGQKIFFNPESNNLFRYEE